MGTYVDANYKSRISGLEKFSFDGFKLSNGELFGPVDVAYKTYGKLSKERDNAIFVCHSISGDCHVSDFYPNSKIPGWWSKLVGPGRYVNTNKYFVICPNVFGGCYGTTGPSSINPKTEKQFGSLFPSFTLEDVISCHQRVLEHLEVDRVKAVFGGSFGGTQTLQWMASFPDSLEKAVPMAASPSTPAIDLAASSIVKRIVENDPSFQGGDYGEFQPINAIALGRLALEVMFVSPDDLQKTYGKKMSGGDYAVSKEIWEKSLKFAKRFDANSFLLMLNAINNFDLGEDQKALEKSLSKGDYDTLCVAVSSDILYPPNEIKRVVEARKANTKNAHYYEINSPNGHDAFFTEIDTVGPKIKEFIKK